MKYTLAIALVSTILMQRPAMTSSFVLASKAMGSRAFASFARTSPVAAAASASAYSSTAAATQLLKIRGGMYDHNAASITTASSSTASSLSLSWNRRFQTLRSVATKSIEPEPQQSLTDFMEKVAGESLGIANASDLLDFGGLKYRINVGAVSSDGENNSDADGSNDDGQYRVLFVLGGPGAGKGTQSDLLLQNYPCVHLSAGELLRSEASKEDSPHAKLISECLVGGKIVPVEISLALLQNAMKEADGKSLIFLVDGFPRNFDNLEGWTKCMQSVSNILGVLVYQCPLDVLEQRILSRAKKSGRSDDNLESLRKRFATFEGDTMPVIDTLRIIEKSTASLNVVDIEADQPLDEVWDDTQSAMNAFLQDDILHANAKLLQAVETNDETQYQRLCAGEFFTEKDVFQKQEQPGNATNIRNAQIEFIMGTKATVSYDRDDLDVRETRIWSHRGNQGWCNIHFVRTPLRGADHEAAC